MTTADKLALLDKISEVAGARTKLSIQAGRQAAIERYEAICELLEPLWAEERAQFDRDHP